MTPPDAVEVIEADRRAAWGSGVVCLPIACQARDRMRDEWFADGGTPDLHMAWSELNTLALAFAAHREAERERCAALVQARAEAYAGDADKWRQDGHPLHAGQVLDLAHRTLGLAVELRKDTP